MYKELVEYIVKCLVESKDEVSVVETKDEEGTIILTVKVAQAEMGRVIGKEGRIIKSIREIVRAYSAKEKIKTMVNIEE